MRRQIFLGPSAILRKKINVKRRVEQRCPLYSFAPTLERARRRGKKTFQGHWLFESLSYALCRCVVTYLLCEKGNKGLWVDGWVSGWTEWDENMNSSSTTGRIDILFFWNPTVNIINPTRNIRIYKQLRGEKRDFLTNHSRAGSHNTRTRCPFFLLGPSF